MPSFENDFPPKARARLAKGLGGMGARCPRQGVLLAAPLRVNTELYVKYVNDTLYA